MAKKRKATDATIRNVRASKRRDRALEERIARLESEQQETARISRELVHALRSLSRI